MICERLFTMDMIKLTNDSWAFKAIASQQNRQLATTGDEVMVVQITMQYGIGRSEFYC